MEAVMELYDRIVSPSLLIRRLHVTAGHVLPKGDVPKENDFGQMSLFDEETGQDSLQDKAAMERERRMQLALLNIKKKYGKNAILLCSPLTFDVHLIFACGFIRNAHHD